MFTSWRILECPVLPQFGVHFIPYSRVSEQPQQYLRVLEGSWACNWSQVLYCSYNPGKDSIFNFNSSRNITTRDILYASKLHHHLLLSAPIKTAYVLNSVKNTLHNCSSPTFHCHMTRKTHEVKLFNYFMCISSFAYGGLSSSSGSSERSIFILKTLVTVQFILKSFQFTASTTFKIKNTLIRKHGTKKFYTNTRTLSKHLYKQNS